MHFVIREGAHTGGAQVVGIHIGGAHVVGGHTTGPHTDGAQAGGAQFGLDIILFGAGANRPPMIADGIPITAPHKFVANPKQPPSKPNGPALLGPHDGGAQLGGGHAGGAHTGGGSTGGPPDIPTDG